MIRLAVIRESFEWVQMLPMAPRLPIGSECLACLTRRWNLRNRCAGIACGTRSHAAAGEIDVDDARATSSLYFGN